MHRQRGHSLLEVLLASAVVSSAGLLLPNPLSILKHQTVQLEATWRAQHVQDNAWARQS